MNEDLTSKEHESGETGASTEPAAEGPNPALDETSEMNVDGSSRDQVAEFAEESAEPVPALSPEEYAELVKKAGERDVFLDELRRARADFDNYQKRMKRELPARELQGLRRLLTDLLPIQDNFELALADGGKGSLESFRQGVEMIQQMLTLFLEGHDTKPIDAKGKPFDPNVHHAVQQLETDDPDLYGKVVEVLQTGYVHGDVVLRPASVIVATERSKAPAAPASPEKEIEGGD